MSFVSELKRRKVFQVAAVYLVVAWLIMQVVDVVNEPLRLPDWFATVAILIVAIGFPIALILSWAFDLTPEGVVKDQGSGATVQSSGRRIEYVFTGLLVIAVATLLYREFTPSEQVVEVVAEQSEQERLPNSVAVLPFTNLSSDPEDAFFAAGIHDTILNELSKIVDLNVIARTSVLRYADGQTPIAQIAEELNVETVMEGTVQYAEEQVRITAQLINPDTGAHIWSGNYDRPFKDIFAIQSEIAERIAMALEAELLPSERESIEQVPTKSPNAYVLFLRARSEPAYGSFRGSSGAPAAIELLNSAISLDPEFALAYLWRSVIYGNGQARIPLIRAGVLDSHESGIRLAQDNLDSALELDENLALAHIRLANQLRVSDWEKARERYELAYQLAPNDPRLLQGYAAFLSGSGLHEEAIEKAARLAELDPTNGLPMLASVHHNSGDNDAAIEYLRRYIDHEPTWGDPRISLAFAEIARGNLNEALAHLRLGEQLLGGQVPGTGVVSEISYAYARAGSLEDAERFFSQIEQPADSRLAHMELVRGNDQAALELLEEIAESYPETTDTRAWSNANLGRLVWNTWNDPILDQPEFVEVRSRLGFRE